MYVLMFTFHILCCCYVYVCGIILLFIVCFFFFSRRRRHTRCALVTGVQTCALPIFAQAIEEDLRWLGLDWDEKAVQSERLERYAAAAGRLKAAGRLYACYETPEELGLKRKVALSAGRPPIYDRAALALSEAEKARLEAEGRRPHWRFRLLPGEVAWEDLVRGPVAFQGENLSDPVLLREDGRPLYTLTSVVDDLELGITHVIRGEDHVANTAVQVQLFEALGGLADGPDSNHGDRT